MVARELLLTARRVSRHPRSGRDSQRADKFGPTEPFETSQEPDCRCRRNCQHPVLKHAVVPG